MSTAVRQAVRPLRDVCRSRRKLLPAWRRAALEIAWRRAGKYQMRRKAGNHRCCGKLGEKQRSHNRNQRAGSESDRALGPAPTRWECRDSLLDVEVDS